MSLWTWKRSWVHFSAAPIWIKSNLFVVTSFPAPVRIKINLFVVTLERQYNTKTAGIKYKRILISPRGDAKTLSGLVRLDGVTHSPVTRLYQQNEYFAHTRFKSLLYLPSEKLKPLNYHHARYSVCQSDVRQGKSSPASFSCQDAAITLGV